MPSEWGVGEGAEGLSSPPSFLSYHHVLHALPADFIDQGDTARRCLWAPRRSNDHLSGSRRDPHRQVYLFPLPPGSSGISSRVLPVR